MASLEKYTEAEQEALFKAVTLSCDCKLPAITCAAHLMLRGDQRTLDHLLFVKRTSQRFIDREHAGE